MAKRVFSFAEHAGGWFISSALKVMSMIPVNSSAIAAIGYENGVLAVTFHNTGTYYHPGVPYEIFLGLLHAGSKGVFYNQHIRGRYR